MVVARAPDLNVIHPSAVETFLCWLEKQSLVFLSRTKPERFRTVACVKMAKIASYQMKLGNIGLLVKMEETA